MILGKSIKKKRRRRKNDLVPEKRKDYMKTMLATWNSLDNYFKRRRAGGGGGNSFDLGPFLLFLVRPSPKQI